MSILGKMGKTAIDFVAGDAICDILGKAAGRLEKTAEKVGDNAEKRFNEYQKKMISKNPNNIHLWMKENQQMSGFIAHKEWSDYLFYDIDGNLKYTAKGAKDNKLQHILIYDEKKCKIAELSEKLVALRNPLSLRKEIHPADFDIIIGNQRRGKLCTVPSWGKQRLLVKFNGWKIEQKSLGISQIVDDNHNVVAEITSKLFSFDMISFLDFSNFNDEILIVLLAVAIRAYSKSCDRKSKHEHEVDEL